MAPMNVRDLTDRLTTHTANERARVDAAAARSTAAPAWAGFRFAPGARVLDLASGQRGAVVRGYRDPARGADLFEVWLDVDRVIVRAGDELELGERPFDAAAR